MENQLYGHLSSLLILLFVIFISVPEGYAQTKEDNMNLELISSVLKENQLIPSKYTCDGRDISPPLSWRGTPEGTKTWAIIVDDPDAPAKTWVHWVIYNIDASITQLPEHLPTTDTLSDGALQGLNDFGHFGYGGPCPPSGTHHYRFTLYAVDIRLNLKAGASKPQLLDAMKGHILAETRLIALYKRN